MECLRTAVQFRPPPPSVWPVEAARSRISRRGGSGFFVPARRAGSVGHNRDGAFAPSLHCPGLLPPEGSAMKTATTTLVLLLTTLAAASATHAAAPAIAPPGTATLEALLARKAGSNFTGAAAIDALQAAGLAKNPGGPFEPEDKPVALFGGTV